MKPVFFVLSFFFIINCQSQIIITAAGTHVAGYGGDGGPFSKATFNYPNYMLYDKAGNLYVTEMYGGRIRKIDAVTKTVSTFLSGMGSLEAIVFDKQEKFMYISDRDKSCVYKLDMSTKSLSVFAGIPGSNCSLGNCGGNGTPALSARFAHPAGMAVDTSGNLYIADQSQSLIKKIDIVTGIMTTYAGGSYCNCTGHGDGGPATSAELLFPYDIIFDNQGNLLISNSGMHNIRKVDAATGIISTIAGLNGFSSQGYTGDGGLAINARLNGPTGMFVDKNDNLYFTENLNHTVRKVDKKGIITTVAGSGTSGYSGDCGPPQLAKMYVPHHVAVEPDGSILVTDLFNNVFREIIDAAPNIITASTNEMCAGDTLSLINTARGGTWQSSNPAVATVDSKGFVNALSQGTTVINYFVSNGCNTNGSTYTLTVKQIPLIQGIQGVPFLCEGSTMNLTNKTSGGVWSSTATTIAAIDNSGLLQGISPGAVSIIYKIFNGVCTNADTFNLVINPKPISTAITGSQNICVEKSTLLSNNIAGGTWSSSDATVANVSALSGIVTGKSNGQAIITYSINNSCGFSTSTIQVNVSGLPYFSLGNDTVICSNERINLKAPPGMLYKWQDGTTSDNLVTSSPGFYWVNVIDNNKCSFSDTIFISHKSLPYLNLGNDTTLCDNATLLLNAGSSFIKNYIWQDGLQTSDHMVTKPGFYKIIVTGQNNCINIDSITIAYMSSPSFSLGNNENICPGTVVILDPHLNNVNYLWHDGSTKPTFSVQQPGNYSLKATNFCGSMIAKVQFSKGVCTLFMPDAFTPNNDNINDIFKIKYPSFINTFHMTIFNKWGEVIFETTDPYRGWDGRFKGISQDSGVYIWTIALTTFEGKVENGKGTVVLIR